MADQVKYLTADQVLALHDFALTIGTKGGEGIRSEHLFLSAVFQPQQTFGDQDLYPTIPEKAAAYGFFLAENQPFLNGNKRTAALALAVFLDLNGYDLWESDEDELARMFEMLANDTIDQGEFFGWVSNHSRKQAGSGA